ncbi:MAG: restriction endonuclease subunit S [Cyanobacteria bacterium J06621_3]
MSEWKTCLLGQLGEITSSKRIFQREYVESGIPFYRTKEIKELANQESVSSELFISRERYEEIKGKFGVPKIGDILVTAIGTVGEIYVVENKEEFYFKDGNVLWLKNFEDVDPYFLRYLLSSLINDLKGLSSGSTYKALPIAKLKSYKVPLPPIAEQRRIAAILDKADAIRRKRKQAIQYTEELLRSAFLDMFGDPVTNPRNWEIVKLGSLIVGKPNNGIFKKNHEYDGGTPVVWVKELFGGHTIDFSESRTLSPTENEVEKYGLKKGDILFCRSSLKLGGIGFSNVFDGMDFSALFECHVIRISPDQQKINSIFLNYLLRLPGLRQQIISKSNTVTMSTIGQGEIKQIKIYLPPKELQDQFERFLRKTIASQKKIEALKLDALFNSLLQRAFKGEL